MRAREPSLILLLAAGLALAARGLGACVDLDALGDGIRDDGGPSEASVGPDTGSLGCRPKKPVGPPPAVEAGVDLPPFVVAVREVILDRDLAPGFDLDDVCTCDTNVGPLSDGGPSCKAPPRVDNCDRPDGVDNGLAELARLIQASRPDASRVDDFAERIINAGRKTLLIEIGGYNGQANDDAVSVALFNAEGLREQGCPSSVATDAGYYTPGWCSKDRWTVNKDSLLANNIPSFLGSGYVRDHRLVARFAGRVILPFSESSFVYFNQATLEGALDPLDTSLQPRDAGQAASPGEEGLWRFQGVVAGRSSTSEVLTTLGTSKLGETLLCKSSFNAMKLIVCGAADIALSNDHVGANCDAVSGAVGFVAEPALRGAVDEDAGLVTNECSPENVDASEYQCPR